MEDNMKEFVAFSKKLLRALKKIRELLELDPEHILESADRLIEAKKLLDELIEDTEGDIQA